MKWIKNLSTDLYIDLKAMLYGYLGIAFFTGLYILESHISEYIIFSLMGMIGVHLGFVWYEVKSGRMDILTENSKIKKFK